MSEIDAPRNVNDGVLRDVDFSKRTRTATPALDYLPEQGLSMVSVPLYPRAWQATESGSMGAARSYTVLVTTDGRRLCVPTSKLPLRISAVPTFIDGESRWDEPLLQAFLENTYTPPSPAELFGNITGVFEKYLDATPVECRLLACWTLATYWFPAWPALGILHVNGAFSSGKSRVLTLLQHLAFAPVNLASATAASVFKICGSATCLLDEAEMIGGPAMRELRLILQSSYRAQGGFVIRSSTKGRVAKWAVFGPKAIASVADLPADGILASRCVVLRLHRSTNAAKTSLRLDQSSEDFGSLRAAIFATALTRWRDLLSTQVDSGTLAARKLECFFPLLQVAQFCDPSGVTAAAIVGYAASADGPRVQPVVLTAEERKIAEAVAALPTTGEELTSAQIRDAVLAQFPELAQLTVAAIGLVLSKHALVRKRRTPQGVRYAPDVARAAALAAQR